jgi:hypothetical protein
VFLTLTKAFGVHNKLFWKILKTICIYVAKRQDDYSKINAFFLLNLTIWNQADLRLKQEEQRVEQHIGRSSDTESKKNKWLPVSLVEPQEHNGDGTQFVFLTADFFAISVGVRPLPR